MSQKLKNLRSMISTTDNVQSKKESPLIKRSSIDSAKDQEVSFNITPDEEEIKRNIITSNNNNYEDNKSSKLFTNENETLFNYESKKFSNFNIIGLDDSVNSKVNIGSLRLNTEGKALIERTDKIIQDIDKHFKYSKTQNYVTYDLKSQSVIMSKLNLLDDIRNENTPALENNITNSPKNIKTIKSVGFSNTLFSSDTYNRDSIVKLDEIEQLNSVFKKKIDEKDKEIELLNQKVQILKQEIEILNKLRKVNNKIIIDKDKWS